MLINKTPFISLILGLRNYDSSASHTTGLGFLFFDFKIIIRCSILVIFSNMSLIDLHFFVMLSEVETSIFQ